ncbi:HNH endonuclease signature motif containing protein, partial [Tersicoccus solisilvae]|uniref:HNH endonuclease signature motif containing protein n=1 Tax=Tersicoccus solisilvae TaxID=1882339 RepID=UPI001667CF19
AATLLGGDEPGWLGEFGPIPAVDARELASRATSFLLAVVADRGDPPPEGTDRPPEGTDRPPDGTDPPPDGTARPPGEVGPPPGRTGRTSERDCRAGEEPAWVVPVALTTGLSYRLPAALRRALVVRDGTCRFPGCRRSAMASDVDHVRAWVDAGTTVPENLAHLCRKHHVLKHHSGWSVTTGSGGEADERGSAARGVSDDGRASSRLRWTSPAGRAYVTDPEPPPF